MYYCFDGATAFLSALLNVNYFFGEADREIAGELIAGDMEETAGELGEAAGEPEDKAQNEENSLYSLLDTRRSGIICL